VRSRERVRRARLRGTRVCAGDALSGADAIAADRSRAARRWDVHCRVVDNYGDAAVCFRLARALALEHGLAVRLIIDRPAVLAALRPALRAGVARQWLEGVEVVEAGSVPADAAPEVAIDAFGGGLDAGAQEALELRNPPGLWIVLEYLTAEPFAAQMHARPSPPPVRAIARWFFFPGFDAGTGGLLRERGLLQARDAFLAEPAATEAFLRRLGVPPPEPSGLRVSLFSYPAQPALRPLLEAMASGPRPVQLLVSPGPVADEVADWARARARPGAAEAGGTRYGALRLHALPFLCQDDYDRLLWGADLNIVRGEDSFVRAQWAGRPLLWRPYPQAAGADRAKCTAFLDRYLAGAPAEAAAALRALHAPWVEGAGGRDPGWSACLRALPVLQAHARHWARARGSEPDLASRLVSFCRGKLQ